MLICKNKLGAVLRAVRLCRNETQVELAKRADVDRLKIGELEAGRHGASTARTRAVIQRAWRVRAGFVALLVEGCSTVDDAAEAFRVPPATLVEAISRAETVSTS